MPTETKKNTISPAFQRRLEEHRAEAARIRAEIGDPEEALRQWVRKNFTDEALIETYREYVAEGHSGADRADWEDERPTDG